MIDDDDVTLAALAGPGGFIGLILVLVVAYFAYQNTTECEQKTCPGGKRARLMAHECLCVEEAK